MDGYSTEQTGPPEPAPVPPPWEERQRYGFFNAAFLTVREVLFSPDRFFTRMPIGAGLAQPLLFAIVLGIVSAFFDWMWSLTGSSLRILADEDLARLVRGQFMSGAGFILSPAFAFASVFVRAGIVHVSLLLTGGERGGFEGTFRAIAYSEAVWILAVLPFCGNVVAVFWGTVAAIIGIRRIHRVDPWRAVLAVLLPLVLCVASCGSLGLFLFTKGLFD